MRRLYRRWRLARAIRKASAFLSALDDDQRRHDAAYAEYCDRARVLRTKTEQRLARLHLQALTMNLRGRG